MTGVWCVLPSSLSLILVGIVSQLNRVRCHNSTVPSIAVALTCGSLIGSHPPTPSTSTSPFFNYPWERVSTPYFRLSLCLLSVRSLGCLELFSNSHWSFFGHQATGLSLWSEYHKNHLIWMNSSLMVSPGLSFKEYSPWVAAGQPVQLHTWPSRELFNLSVLDPDDLTWVVLPWELILVD